MTLRLTFALFRNFKEISALGHSNLTKIKKFARFFKFTFIFQLQLQSQTLETPHLRPFRQLKRYRQTNTVLTHTTLAFKIWLNITIERKNVFLAILNLVCFLHTKLN